VGRNPNLFGSGIIDEGIGGLQEVVSVPRAILLIIFNKTRIFVEKNQQ